MILSLWLLSLIGLIAVMQVTLAVRHLLYSRRRSISASLLLVVAPGQPIIAAFGYQVLSYFHRVSSFDANADWIEIWLQTVAVLLANIVVAAALSIWAGWTFTPPVPALPCSAESSRPD